MRQATLYAASLALALAILATTRIGGFSYAGHRWAGASADFYVNCSQIASMTCEQAIVELQQAADNWTAQAAIPFRFVYRGQTTRTSGIQGVYWTDGWLRDGVNVVEFRPCTSDGTCSGASGFYAYGATGFIIETDMVFREQGYPFYPGASGCITGRYLQDLATHEFGHWLGLGHSDVGTATMYATSSVCDLSRRSLDADDALGARYAYGTTLPPPPPEICGDGLDNDGDGLIDEGCTPPPPTVTCTLDGRIYAQGERTKVRVRIRSESQWLIDHPAWKKVGVPAIINNVFEWLTVECVG